jgi:hypothetical protein
MPTHIRRPVDGALWAFDKGFKVFPIKENKKIPAVKDWQEWAKNADRKKIENYGTAQAGSNWGIFCDEDLLVIDVDNKTAKPGFESLKQVEEELGQLPDTTVVTTPTEGIHIYLKGKGATTAGKLGHGLDTRGRGGYVVAPGSRINNFAYELDDTYPVASAPQAYIEAIGKKSISDIEVLDDKVKVEEGERNKTLASLAGTMRRRGMGYEAIKAALMAVNEYHFEEPVEEEEIDITARSISQYKPEHAIAASDFMCDPVDFKHVLSENTEPAKFKPRDWIMQGRYIGGYISTIISQGGVGKSLLALLDAVSIVTGKPLTGFDVVKTGNVWVYNTEDPLDEMLKRLTAISIHHKIKIKDIKGIHLSSGREQPFILAKNSKDGVVINQQAIDSAVQFIRDNDIKVMIADPFVRTHECSENDNMQIDKVAWCFQRIIDRTGCAIGIVHHISKAGANTAADDQNKARGASSLINATRIAHNLSPMKVTEAARFGIPEERRGWYMRFDNAKANLQPPAKHAIWFEKKSVDLLCGDSVGTIEPVKLDNIEQENIDLNRIAFEYDLGVCLDRYLNLKQEMSLRDVVSCIQQDENHSHLVANDMSFKSFLRKFKEAMEGDEEGNNKGIVYGHKHFKYKLRPEKRVKHFVSCTLIQEGEEDYNEILD